MESMNSAPAYAARTPRFFPRLGAAREPAHGHGASNTQCSASP